LAAKYFFFFLYRKCVALDRPDHTTAMPTVHQRRELAQKNHHHLQQQQQQQAISMPQVAFCCT